MSAFSPLLGPSGYEAARLAGRQGRYRCDPQVAPNVHVVLYIASALLILAEPGTER
jgi:hypothetical protein